MTTTGRRYRISPDIGQELAEQLEALMRETEKTQSEVVKDALARYFETLAGNGAVLSAIGFSEGEIAAIEDDYGDVLDQYGGDYKPLLRAGLISQLRTLQNKVDKLESSDYSNLSFNEIMEGLEKGTISPRLKGLVELKLGKLLQEIIDYNDRMAATNDDRVVISNKLLQSLSGVNPSSFKKWRELNAERIESHLDKHGLDITDAHSQRLTEVIEKLNLYVPEKGDK